MNWSHLELPASQRGQWSTQTGSRLLPPGDNFQNWTRPSAWPTLPAPPVMRPTKPHLWLDCLTMHTFVPCSQFNCLFKPIAQVCTPKMAEISWVLTLPLSTGCPKLCNKPPFSAFTMSLYFMFRGGWYVESQEFGPWIQKLQFYCKTFIIKLPENVYSKYPFLKDLSI
jgi:hypothetical protein